MNFGARLPGPFRVGINSKGRLSGGITIGPLSASTSLGGGTEPSNPGAHLHNVTLAQAAQHARNDGWRVRPHGTDAVLITKGLRQGLIAQTGQGVAIRQQTHPAKVAIVIGALIALIAICNAALT